MIVIVVIAMLLELTKADFPPIPFVEFPYIDEGTYWDIATEQRTRQFDDDFMMIVMRPPGCHQCDIHAHLLNQVYDERLGPSIRKILPVSSNISKTLYYDQTRSEMFTCVIRAGLGVDYLDTNYFEQEVNNETHWEAKKDTLEKFIRNHARLTSYEVFSAEDVLDRHHRHDASKYSIVYIGHDIKNTVRQYRMFSQAVRPEDQVLAMHAFKDEEGGKQIMEYFNMDEDSCFLVLKGDDYDEVQCPKVLTNHFIVEVLKTYLYERVLNLNDKRDQGRIKFYGDSALIMLLKSESEQHLATLDRLAGDYEGKLLFGYMIKGSKEYDEMFEFIELGQETPELYKFPAVVIFQIKSGRRTYLYEGKFSYDAIKTFIKGYFKQELVSHYRSQRVPEDQPENATFREVVGQTFFDEIIMSNKSALLYLYQNRTCEVCLKMEANITNATADFMSMINLYAMYADKNKSPYCHVQGSPRLVLFQNQSEFRNNSIAQLEKTHLPGKLYLLFQSDQFQVENVVTFLYEQLFKVKMNKTQVEQSEDSNIDSFDFDKPENQEWIQKIRERLHKRKTEDLENEQEHHEEPINNEQNNEQHHPSDPGQQGENDDQHNQHHASNDNEQQSSDDEKQKKHHDL